MKTFTTWLILIVAIRCVSAADNPVAVEQFHCDFAAGWDRNYDRFPDNWTRRRDADHPEFLQVELVDDADATSQRCLRMELNGGAAAAYSPPVRVSSQFAYLTSAMVRTDGLVNDRAWVTVTFFDAEQKPVGRIHRSTPIREAPQWTRVTIGPMAPDSPEARTAVIGLHVGPQRGFDIEGVALFDDVRLSHLPRMRISTDRSHNLFRDGETVTIRCSVSGVLAERLDVEFTLLDVTGAVVDQATRQIVAEAVNPHGAKGRDADAGPSAGRHGYAGGVVWTPRDRDGQPTLAPGFYRARIRVHGAGQAAQQRETTLAVVAEQAGFGGGEFGWSLPDGEGRLSLADLDTVLGEAGVGWVKFPVWYGRDKPQRGADLVRFAELLERRGVRIVGLLVQPPSDVRPKFGAANHLYAADIFRTEAELWHGSVEPVMTRLSSKVQQWQLGADNDTSFVWATDMVPAVRSIKEQLEQFGQHVDLALGWPWQQQLKAGDRLPWRYVSMSADPPLTSGEMAAYLEGNTAEGIRRWVQITPLPGREASVDDRAHDLVQKMLAAKMHGADGAFLAHPFHDRRGVMNADGTPGELFLTWRTLAHALAGADYLGSLQLPGASTNHVFARDGEAVMILWNDTPGEERISLGKDIRQIDGWGRPSPLSQSGDQHVVRVGSLPTVVIGMDRSIAKMAIEFQLTETKLPSVFGATHRNALRLTNPFDQGIRGQLVLHFPKAWKTAPIHRSFKLAAQETHDFPIEIKLPYDASSGRRQIRVDFDVHGVDRYQFRVYRRLDVGLGDVLINVSTHLSDDGSLIVRQEMTNHTERKVDFNCSLFAPRRRLKRSQVIRLGYGKDVRIYRYENGREMIGQQLWLKAEEVDGERFLNYKFTATKQATN